MASTAVKVVLGAVVGMAAGGLVTGGVAGVWGYARLNQSQAGERAGWNLAPVAVAGRDLEPGTQLSSDDLSQASVPEVMLTASLVRAESVSYVFGQRIQAPLRAGDPLWWGFFQAAELKDRDLAEACFRAIDVSALVPKQVRSAAELRARLAAEAAR